MNKKTGIGILLFLGWAGIGLSQLELPREYIPEKELVVLSSSLEIGNALDILSEYAVEFAKKPIFDPLKTQGQIGIDIRSLPWRKALEIILSKHGLWYVEREHFFEVVRTAKGQQQGGTVTEADFVELDGGKEIHLGARGVKIEAIFFQANRKKLREWGIDWSTFYNGKIEVRADQFGTLPLGDDMLSVLVAIPQSIAKVDVTGLLRTFDTSNIGEVLAQPQIVVTEGQEGIIQVGEDFSIKTRDFAGNIIDKFFSTGTIMKVTPYVLQEKDHSYIFLDVRVERSSAHPDVVSTIIKKSEATSFIQLYDGEQTLIAGLYSNETNTLRKGVPFLKDLPWWLFGLRYLFGFNRNEVIQMELVILLKASVLPDVRNRRQDAVGSSSLKLNLPPNQDLKDTKKEINKTREAMHKVNANELRKKYHQGRISLIRKGFALVEMGEGFEPNKLVGRNLMVIRRNKSNKKINRIGTLRIIKANHQLAAAKIIEELKDYRVKEGDFVIAQLY